MSPSEFDALAKEKQYIYHRRQYAAVRDIESSLRLAEKNIIRDMSKYMPPNVVDPKTWMKLNAGPDALANLRKKAMELPEPMRSQWMAKLDKPSWRAQITNRTALYRRIDMEGVTAKRSIDATLRKTAASVAAEGYARQMYEIQKGAGMGWGFDVPNTMQADAMARRVLNTKFTANLTKRHSDLIREQITGGILSGKGTKEIAAQVNETAGSELWEAKRLVRTEITAAASEGELQAIRDTEDEFDIKMQYRFYATLDERTCPICGELDLQVFSPDEAQEGVNKPPMHPNCRCVIQPVMDGETKDEIVRRGRDEGGKGTVMPPGMSYKEWKEEYGTVAKNATVGANVPKEDPLDDTLKSMAYGLKEAEKEAQEAKARDELSAMFKDSRADGIQEKQQYIDPFKDVKTIDELQKVSRDVFGVEVSGIRTTGKNKTDIELLRDNLGNLGRVANDNPEIKGSLEKIELTNVKKAYAQVVWGKNNTGQYYQKLQLSASHFSSREKMAESLRNDDVNSMKKFGRPFAVGGEKGPEMILVHESGHILHNIAAAKQFNGFVGMPWKDALPARNEFLDGLVKKAVSEVDPSVDTSAGRMKMYYSISHYAGNDRRETIAEATNDYYLNGDNANPLSKAIYKLLQTYLR